MEPIESDAATEIRSLELSSIDEVVDPGEFPVTTQELIDEFGEYVVNYPSGSERLVSILRTSGLETYESPDEIQMAILNGVDRDAVGRPRYSDRSDERDVELDREHQSL